MCNLVKIIADGAGDNLRLPRDMRYAKQCLFNYGIQLVLSSPPDIDPSRYPLDPQRPYAGKPRAKYGRLTSIAPAQEPPKPPPAKPYEYTEPGKRKLHEMLAEAARNTKKGSDDEQG